MVSGSALVQSPISRARPRPGRFRPVGPAVLATLALFIVLFHETLGLYLENWLDPNSNYGHGLLVVAMSLYVLWSSRRDLVHARARPSLAGACSVALLSLGWGCAHLVHVEVAEEMAVAALLPAMVWALLGVAVLRRVLFPLLFLWMAVPVWEYLMPLLQELSARVSSYGLQWLGVPVYREGNQIVIPAGRFEIAEYCAGLRYLLAALSIGIFFAWQRIGPWRTRLLFIGGVVAVALAANWLRVIIVILAGHLTEMRSSLVRDHALMGWLLFAAVMLPVFWFGGGRRSAPSTSGRPAVTPEEAASSTGSSLAGRVGLVFGVLAIGPVMAALLSPALQETAREMARTPAFVLPEGIGDWTGFDRQAPRWRPDFHGASYQAQAWYRGTGGLVGLHVAYYARQEQGSEAVFVLNSPYDRSAWHIDGAGRTLIDLAGRAMDVLQYRLVSVDGRHRLLWSWYDVAGHSTASAFLAKVYELEGLLRGRDDAAVVSVVTDEDSWVEGRRSLRRFLEAAYPVIRSRLDARQDDES